MSNRHRWDLRGRLVIPKVACPAKYRSVKFDPAFHNPFLLLHDDLLMGEHEDVTDWPLERGDIPPEKWTPLSGKFG